MSIWSVSNQILAGHAGLIRSIFVDAWIWVGITTVAFWISFCEVEECWNFFLHTWQSYFDWSFTEFYEVPHSLSKLRILKWVVSRNLWKNVSALFLGNSHDIPCPMISSQVNGPWQIQCFLGNTGNTNHCLSKSNDQKGVPLRNASAKPSRGSNDSPGKFVREVQGIESSRVPREIFLQEGNIVARYLTSLHDFTSAYDPSS